MRRVRAWIRRPIVALTLCVLMLAFLIVADGRRLRASALWGSAQFRNAALAGVAVALVGVAMMAAAIRRQDRDSPREPVRLRSHWLGISYTLAMLGVFVATHHRYGKQPAADNEFMVGALTAIEALAVSAVGLLSWGIWRWYVRRRDAGLN